MPLSLIRALVPMKCYAFPNMAPIRINKYLADHGYTTRRGADTLIEQGLVFINDRKAVLGDKVMPDDTVHVATKTKPAYRYIAYYKPKGIVTHSPQGREKEIKDVVPIEGIFPIGRLDKNSHGLIILTNDGRITDRLLNPAHEHEKEYIVTTAHKLRSRFKEKMESGVLIEGYRTKPTRVKILGDNTFRITLTEGKRHQIKRMVVALFNEVTDLKRTCIMNIQLGNLSPGSYRDIEGAERAIFLENLGL